MKNYKIIIFLSAVTLITACKKYNTFPLSQQTVDRVFDARDSLGANANKFLLTVYSQVINGQNRIDNNYLDAATDDAVPTAAAISEPLTQIATGTYTSFTFGFGSGDNVWSACYAGIRSANVFINNIDVVPVQATMPNIPNLSMKYAWKNEARFLRAYFYFQLIERYGGVPLIGDKVFNVGDNVKLPRNTFEQCVNYIVGECDAIKDTLLTAPLATSNYGRVTKGAALALKARVLLYAASPLFNGTTLITEAKAGNTGIGPRVVTDPNIVGYQVADQNRWKLAADAANDVIALKAYSLNPVFPDIFLDYPPSNNEVIFAKIVDAGTNVENKNGPIGFPAANSNGYTSPTQDLVDAFPMLSGIDIHAANSGFKPDSPYAHRDPRLQQTVFVNEQVWLNTPLQLFQGGQSIPNSGVPQTVTGYYSHKFMGESERVNNYVSHNEDWTIFRYAEILLNYAEAKNEFSGPSPDVYQKLFEVRKRAGISQGNGTYGLTITADKAVLRGIIQNERRIEMAFEEQRFFDIRRWKIAPTQMNPYKHGVQIVKSVGETTINYINVLPDVYKQNTFTPNQYLQPIPYNEVIGNLQMQQNPGW